MSEYLTSLFLFFSYWSKWKSQFKMWTKNKNYLISERQVWVRLLWRHLLVISISDQGIPRLAERHLITTITHMNYCQREDGILVTHSKEGTPRLLLRWLVIMREMRGFLQRGAVIHDATHMFQQRAQMCWKRRGQVALPGVDCSISTAPPTPSRPPIRSISLSSSTVSASQRERGRTVLFRFSNSCMWPTVLN